MAMQSSDALALPLDSRALKGEGKPFKFGRTAEPEARRAPAPAPEKAEADPAPQEPKPRRRRLVGVALGALLVALGGAGGYLYWEDASHYQSTDDAFIAARQYNVSPKVGGYLVSVPVTDNQHVNAGDVIAKIDDRDYRVALAQADAQVEAAQASINNVDAQTSAQEAQINQAEANVEQAQANLTFAEQQASRYETLAHDGSGSVQNAQQYGSQLRQQQATLKSADAALNAARQQLGALKAQRASAVASLAQANAQRDQAVLNLGYTTLTAAQSGRIVQLSASVGELAQAGANLAILVPDEIWVTANFKETQLSQMRDGQPVTIDIDSLPQDALHGHVASLQPGSGTAFSLLPAENATGNYVKIVQRVPVKIIIDNPPAQIPLGPGMSVVPTVRTNPEPSLIERLRRSL